MNRNSSRCLAFAMLLNASFTARLDAQQWWLYSPRFHMTAWTAYLVNRYTLLDVDGDSFPEIALTVGQPGFSYRRNLRDGRFGPVVVVTDPSLVPWLYLGLAAADVDGDGDTDAVVTRVPMARESGVLLFLNVGGGNFVLDKQGRMPVLSQPFLCAAFCDVNGDTRPDLLLGAAQGQPRLLMNQGGGTFVDETHLRVPGATCTTYRILVSDLDGNGQPDVVLANGFRGGTRENSRCLLNHAGIFQDTAAFSDYAGYAWDATAVDVNGDALPDVVFALDDFDTRLYVNQGGARFANESWRLPPSVGTSGQSSVVNADMDGDGDFDLVFGQSGLLTLLNDGTGNYAESPASSFGYPFHGNGMTAGDVDGDGDVDLVASRIDLISGSAGVVLPNLRRQLDASTAPTRSLAWVLDAYAEAGHAMVLCFGASPALYRVPPYGIWQLAADPMVVAPPLILGAGRKRSMSVSVPADPWLQGLPVRVQAVDVDLGSLERSRFSNVLVESVK